VKILLVSQMYPGPGDPDLGVFVAQLERALRERGHEIERAVLDSRAGGKRRYLTLTRRAVSAARRFKPDVVYAHFLVPTGAIAGLASRAPLVVTAHGRDVRNVGAIRGVGTLTRGTIRRASAVIAVSDYLRRELEAKVPEARGKTEVIDSGVDLERFRVKPAPDGLPLPRRAHGAQERRPPRRRLRRARTGHADVRRRRALAAEARGTPQDRGGRRRPPQ